jgi:hypothetical protein
MYIRIYPNKNATIFKRNQGSPNEVLGVINTGKSPIAQITDGNTQSNFLMGFNISSIKTLLTTYPFTCNIKMWDAATVFEPAITLKELDLIYFEEDFSEGDGFSFLGNNVSISAVNWNERVTGTPWSPVQPGTFTQGLIPALQLNDVNQDIIITGLESFITTALTNNVDPKFGLRISSNTPSDQTYTKFIYTRQTRTIFKPFLEFFIDDSIVDKRYNTIATIPSKIYIKNNTGTNFTSSPTAELQQLDGTVLDTPTVVNPEPGIYYITITPDISTIGTVLNDVWKIGSTTISKGIIQVTSPNQPSTSVNTTGNLFFFPTTTYTHQTIRQNDVITFTVTSEVRGKGSVILPGYEYRIVSTNNFEMQPWTPVNLYGGKLYFTVDTSYYFPGIEYEVFVRLKEGQSIKTSILSYKFRLIADEASHMQSLAANPYSDRSEGFKLR